MTTIPRRVLTAVRSRWRRRSATAAVSEAEHTTSSGRWLWVIRESDATVREVGDRGWWTCSPDTRAGDRALIYRTAPHSDIAYLVQATTDAFPVEPGHGLPPARSDAACDYVVLQCFERPLTIGAMREDASLTGWSALRISFRGGVHPVPDRVWRRLLTQLGAASSELLAGRMHVFRRESDIQQCLVEEPDRFERVGLPRLRLVSKELRLPSRRRPDLVFRTSTGRLIVVELKQGRVHLAAVEHQLADYMAELAEVYPGEAPPLGLVVGSTLDPDARTALSRLPGATFASLADLGFTAAPRPTSRSVKRTA